MAAAAAVVAVAACANPTPPTTEVQTPVPTAQAPTASPNGNWTESLSFTGDVRGTMYQVVVGDASTRSECTGRNSRYGGAWASTLYGTVDQDVYGLLVTVRP